MALVFHCYPLREFGCGFGWRNLSHLVDGSTPFVALAIHRCSLAGFVAVLLFRELGKESSEIELPAKRKASSEAKKVNPSGAGVPKFRRKMPVQESHHNLKQTDQN